jgi:hypothetical protein
MKFTEEVIQAPWSFDVVDPDLSCGLRDDAKIKGITYHYSTLGRCYVYIYCFHLGFWTVASWLKRGTYSSKKYVLVKWDGYTRPTWESLKNVQRGITMKTYNSLPPVEPLTRQILYAAAKVYLSHTNL